MNESRINILSNVQARENALLRSVYTFMTLGLLVTGIVSFLASQNQTVVKFFLMNPMGSVLLMIIQFGLVIYLSARIEQMSRNNAITAFFAYSVVSGISLSAIFLVYTYSVIWQAFLSCAVMFGITSIFAATTKKSIANWGGYLSMALIGLIVASLLNMFFRSSAMTFLISIIGIVVFVGLTAWDTQKIVSINRQYGSVMSVDEYTKLGVLGALELYLDFLNIFLYLLRLFGNRRD